MTFKDMDKYVEQCNRMHEINKRSCCGWFSVERNVENIKYNEDDHKWYMYDSEYEPNYKGEALRYCPWCAAKL